VLERVLVDTGPLVSILSARDEHHKRCTRALESIRPPLLTCWPVLTEATWLLRREPFAVDRLLSTVREGWLELLPLAADAAAPIARILEKYRSLDPQIADAALVHLAEQERIDTIFTLDRRDFSVYRIGGRRRFRIVPD
jgi:predicted nucleic acid-binding protein